jgi:hypothetical protein
LIDFGRQSVVKYCRKACILSIYDRWWGCGNSVVGMW